LDSARVNSTVLPNLAEQIYKPLVRSVELRTTIKDNLLGLSVRTRGLAGVKVIVNYLGNGGFVLNTARRQGVKIVTDFISNPNHWELLEAEQRKLSDWPSVRANALEKNLYRRRFEWLLEVSDLCLCPSPIIASELIRIRPEVERRVRIIPYGNTLGSRRSGVRVPGRILFAASHVTVGKGLQYLAEAMPALRQSFPAAQAVVAGDVPPAVRRRFDSSGLLFLGMLSTDAMLNEYAQADIFCLPSVSEGSPSSIYEALAHGVPVVTTRAAGSVVIDGVEGRVLVEPSVRELVAAISDILGDDARREQMSRSAIRASSEYSAENSGRMFVREIESLLTTEP